MTEFKTGLTRRRVLAGAAGVGLAAPFVNKTALGQTPSGQIRVWTFMSAGGTSPRERVLRAIIDEFQAKHPGTTVVVESQPFTELETRFVAATAQRRAPDLIWMRDTLLSLVVDRNALADLDQELTPEFRRDAIPDLFDAFAKKSVIGGKRVSLPLWPSPAQIIFYRKDALREIGLTAPPLDWPGFIDASARLTKGPRFGLGLPTSDNAVSGFINIMSGFGPGMFDQATGRIDLDGPQALETAETVRQLVARNAISNTLLNATGDDLQDQFAAGRFAMLQAFAPRFQQFRQIAAGYDGRELAVSAWPSFGGRPPAALLGPYWTVGLSPSSQNKVTAVAFLEALYSREASLRWAKDAGLVPDRRSVLSDAFFSQPEAEISNEFQKILGGAGAFTFPPRVADITRMVTVLNTALQKIIGTTAPTRTILNEAKATLGW